MVEKINKTRNLGLNKSPENNFDYLNHKYKELLDENWDNLDYILANRELSVQQFGAVGDGKDYTAEIQSAIDSLPAEGGIVYIPAGLYLINTWAEGSEAEFPLGGISLKDNTVLSMAPGAVFKAIPNNHPDYTIVRATDKKNVAVFGGVFIGDRDQHLGTSGEWGYGISIIGSHGVVIKDCATLDCWGDGVYVGSNKAIGTESTNVKLINVNSDNNRRFGLNVTGCIGAHVDLSTFSNTNGKLPETGVNLKPANGNRIVKDVNITNSYTINNKGLGMEIHTGVDGTVVTGNVVRLNDVGIRNKADNSRLSDNTIELNVQDGLYLEETEYSIIESNICRKNGKHGIYATKSSNNLITTNMAFENGQDTDNIVDNIAFANNSSNNSIQNNMTRKGITANSVRYGLSILTTDCTNNFVVNNDLYDGGKTGELHNLGTNTIDSGNKTTLASYGVDAKLVKITDTTNIIDALNVDGAIDEIFSKLKQHIESLVDSHDASSISISDPGDKTIKTNVEDAIQEIYDEVKKSRTYAP